MMLTLGWASDYLNKTDKWFVTLAGDETWPIHCPSAASICLNYSSYCSDADQCTNIGSSNSACRVSQYIWRPHRYFWKRKDSFLNYKHSYLNSKSWWLVKLTASMQHLRSKHSNNVWPSLMQFIETENRETGLAFWQTVLCLHC